MERKVAWISDLDRMEVDRTVETVLGLLILPRYDTRRLKNMLILDGVVVGAFRWKGKCHVSWFG